MKFVRLPRHVTNIHYAWVMLGIAIAMRLVSSVERTASGVLLAYLVDPAGEFGWSRSVVGLALSLQWICSGIFGPPAGWLGDRYGLRLAMAVGALLFLTTSVLIGLVTAPWQFILYFGILMSAALAIFQVPLITAVTMWFHKHLGVAMGLLQSAQGLANLLFAPLMVVLLTQLGWRWAFWGPGIVGGLLLLGLIRYFRNEPAEVGLRPLGADPKAPYPARAERSARPRAHRSLSPAGPAHLCLLEPHWYSLLGVRWTRHHYRLSGGHRSNTRTVPRHGRSSSEYDVRRQLLHALRRPYPGRPGGKPDCHGPVLRPAGAAHCAALLGP